MTTDQKLDELLRMVQGHELRFSQIDGRLKEQEERSEARDKINQVRFDHLTNGVDGLRIEVREIKTEMTKMNVDLNAKIDHVYDSLSQDIQAFAGDLYKFEKRLPRPKKKSLS